uniref:AC transposase n=1 Tax=Fusarium oxysporum (strain Fo5176) TaxID=660025 RepID=A0A0D2YDU0_FUSOF
MSETALKGSIISSPSPSPPPTFPHLGSRPKSIAKQYAAALALASTTDSSVHDLHKITWGQRRFVIASLLDRRKSRGRRSWIGNHGWFLAELKRDNTSSGDIWCCRLCDDKGAPRFFNAQSTSSAQAHLYKLSDFPISRIPWGRTSAKKELEDILSLKKAAVREELDEAVTQIHINFNLWTSPNRLAFISIFGHFIDRSNSHQSRLHAFRRQIGSHAGENIAYTVRNVVRDWGIDRKIGVSICDNAASNDVCLRNFYTNLDASITRADAEARRMRCFGHILNLVAQAFLYGDDAASFELQSEAYGMLERVEEDLEHWRAKGPVGKLHNIVKFIRASPQRTEAFKAHAREQEEADIYKLAEESTAELEVIQNNATRWNSTYMMIERALVKQSELNSFIQDLGLEADASKRVPMADILTSDDWKVLREVSHILEPIYNMTMRTQGWGTSGGHGRLWEVMTGMEYILEHLEDWRLLYEDETANHATEERRRAQGEELESVADTKSMSARPFVVRQTRERPLRQSRLPSRLQGFEITPLHRRRETVLSACPSTSPLFNEGALPVHSRGDYLQDDARSLQWLRDAKDGIKAYFERWYSKNDDDSSESISATSSLTPRPEQSSSRNR